MADHPSNRPSLADLDALFTYHPPTPETKKRYAAIRSAGMILAREILSNCPPSADTSAAIRKVREAVWAANSAIALRPPEA